ncbi:hypothetical protein [Butyricimonas virosa]|uniref:hypothetical protein n=1 Tax=Butyricimonas virosa TaxID=544645 RepID=UPI00242B5B96|nr:hypothetical protein [Butyricimonas virosa]
MSDVKFRLAKLSDAKQIANVHWRVRDRYHKGIFLSLGERFLRTYYRIILNDPYEVVVCAINKSGKIIGFSSATLNAKSQAESLRKNKLKLGFSALGAVLLNPSLLKALWVRYRSLDRNSEVKFVHTEGVRGEYWCWLKDEEDGIRSIELGYAKENIIYNLGYRELFFEVDKFNKRVYKFYSKLDKAEIVEEIVLPDGRERVLFKKVLKSNNGLEL